MELQGRAAELRKAGISIVAVSYDPPETLAAFAAARKITFPLLSDEGSAVIRQYGLLNDTLDPSSRFHGVPHPGTFMLDARRRVTSRHFEEAYQERSTVSSILMRQGGAGSGPVQTAANAQISMTAGLSDAVVAPGSRITLAVEVTPGRRIHVYAPGAEGYKVIAIALDPNPLLTIHPTRYPPSGKYHFAPLNETVDVYTGPFRLLQDISVKATREAQAQLKDLKTLTLTGRLEYQACDDRICFNPATIPLRFDLQVKPLER